MSVENRIDALKIRHQELDVALQTAATQACPDDVEVHGLKKAKLRIKDELSTLMQH